MTAVICGLLLLVVLAALWGVVQLVFWVLVGAIIYLCISAIGDWLQSLTDNDY